MRRGEGGLILGSLTAGPKHSARLVLANTACLPHPQIRGLGAVYAVEDSGGHPLEGRLPF
jgi:hypothetical protein